MAPEFEKRLTSVISVYVNTNCTALCMCTHVLVCVSRSQAVRWVPSLGVIADIFPSPVRICLCAAGLHKQSRWAMDSIASEWLLGWLAGWLAVHASRTCNYTIFHVALDNSNCQLVDGLGRQFVFCYNFSFFRLSSAFSVDSDESPLGCALLNLQPFFMFFNFA